MLPQKHENDIDGCCDLRKMRSVFWQIALPWDENLNNNLEKRNWEFEQGRRIIQ